MMLLQRVIIPKPPQFIITKEYGGFTIKKRVKKTDYVRFLFFFKKKYEYFGYDSVLKKNIIISSLGILKTDVRVFESKKDVKKYIKENTQKKYFVY